MPAEVTRQSPTNRGLPHRWSPETSSWFHHSLVKLDWPALRPALTVQVVLRLSANARHVRCAFPKSFSLAPLTSLLHPTNNTHQLRRSGDMSDKSRYTVKFVTGERRGSLLVLLSPSQPCSALTDAVKKRVPEVTETVASLHLEEADGPQLYGEDTLSNVLPGAEETAVVVFEVSDVSDLRPSRTRIHVSEIGPLRCRRTARHHRAKTIT
jgi:hypothetical protein